MNNHIVDRFMYIASNAILLPLTLLATFIVVTYLLADVVAHIISWLNRETEEEMKDYRAALGAMFLVLGALITLTIIVMLYT